MTAEQTSGALGWQNFRLNKVHGREAYLIPGIELLLQLPTQTIFAGRNKWDDETGWTRVSFLLLGLAYY